MRWNEIFEDNINELFDKTSPIHWGPNFYDMPGIGATFHINDKKYQVSFTKRPSSWLISFELKRIGNTPLSIDMAHSNTGTGDQFLVYSTVIKCIDEFIHKEDPMVFVFTGDIQQGKGDLYRKMISYLTKKLNRYGYIMDEEKSGKQNIFKFSKRITEAPIDSFNLHGFDDPDYDNDSFSAMDKKTLVNPKAQAKLIKRFENIPYHFYMYFINLKDTPFIDKDEDDFNKNFDKTEQGTFSPEYIEDKFGVKVDLPKDGYGVVYLSNANPSWNRIPMTPWILAHRFAHGLDGSKYGKLNQVYGAIRKLGMIGVDVTNLLTMKSARTGQLDTIESPVEMLTQFIMNGKISYTTDRLPTEYRNDPKINQELKKLFDVWNQEAASIMRSVKGKIIVTS